MSVNKALILGNLGAAPEIKHTASGLAICNLSVATSESWTDKNSGQKQEKTEWHRVNVFGKQAEHCAQYLSKGSKVFVEGRIETRSYDDKDGNKRYTTEIKANNVTFVGSKSDNQSNQNTQQAIDTSGEFADEEIPF